jgi:hypothetical protein
MPMRRDLQVFGHRRIQPAAIDQRVGDRRAGQTRFVAELGQDLGSPMS